jgi:hypothetical protein
MRRHATVGSALALAVAVAACSDVPAPTSKGNRAVGVEAQEAQEARPAPKTEQGVVPRLIGVSVGDAKKAIVDAGFETGTVDTPRLFGTPTNKWIVCEQAPAGGASPRKGTKVALTADRQC